MTPHPPPVRNMEVRGYTSHNTPALTSLRALSKVIDTCLILLAVLLTSDYFKISPIPRFSSLFLFLTITTLYWIPQKKLFGVTLGERAWLLKPKNKGLFSLKEHLYQRDFLAPFAVFTATLVTTFSILFTVTTFRKVVLAHPNWLQAQEWKLKTFVPNQKDWTVSPFFYLLGGWPKSFRNKPIFYSLPYEAGPPTRFVGHVTAYWDHPDISLTFEGPKTPELAASGAELRSCFIGRVYSLHCLFLRETALNRHIHEIRKTKNLVQWTLKWFNVENPLLIAQDLPQGIYLSAISKNWTQDRFIFINANGTHQAMILRRPNNERGQKAFQLLQNSIGSIRNFSELNSGKAWINQELEATQLNDLKFKGDSSLLSIRLGEVQQMLISKITVEPSDFNSYFHLAGTSVMLAKATPEHRLRIKVALDNLESAQRFATDIAPTDPRLGQIQALDTEMRKLLTAQGG